MEPQIDFKLLPFLSPEVSRRDSHVLRCPSQSILPLRITTSFQSKKNEACYTSFTEVKWDNCGNFYIIRGHLLNHAHTTRAKEQICKALARLLVHIFAVASTTAFRAKAL